jgi:UDPglucose--hexose-1-phosphate uridylyltransferase
VPELRKDVVIGRWVIIATERICRPDQFAEKKDDFKEGDNGFCPFCEGNEDKTPPEIFAIRKENSLPNTPNWEIRVVPNKYPALRIEGELKRRGIGMFDIMNGIGAHEVIIETPNHNLQMHDFSIDHLSKVIYAYKIRSLDLKKDLRLRYIMLFKNYGREAGASLFHSHSQLIATPVTPKRVKEELNGARTYYEYKERCVFCDIINQEIDSAKRIIYQNQYFIAISPFASRFPFETWILPLNHNPDFDTIDENEIKQLSEMMIIILKKLNIGLSNPSYNFLIHTAPSRYLRPGYWQTIDKDFHWHIEIIPKLTRPGGFEWGTGLYINPVPPENATEFLKEIKI